SIIMSAKILLKSSDSTIMQISEELNFPNPSYFGRYFKKATGMTPKEYREQ
ncbi:MAG: AraC family transcriptional regulator, partial [Petrimonas sp.]|nr:AraC family transcriptional regulator [Petrimonas sp.]MEA5063333.1 AraC family transcriptional regulator [Petrimonas sp.]